MSSDTSPAEAFSNDLPPSVERHTPPISRPANTRSGSSGSKAMRVTRGFSTAGQVSGSGAFTRSQVFAPSVERKMPGGRVPARIRSGSCGERATDQMHRLVHLGGQVGPFPARDVEPVDAGIGAGQQLPRPLRDAPRAPTRASPSTCRTCPRNAAAFRRGHRCTRRKVPPSRCRDEASHGVSLADSRAAPMMNPAANRGQCAASGRQRDNLCAYLQTLMVRSIAQRCVEPWRRPGPSFETLASRAPQDEGWR